MGNYVAGNVIRGFAEMSFNGQTQFGNVFHWQVDGAATGGTDTEFANGAIGWLEAFFQDLDNLMVNDAKFEQVTFYNITQDRPAGVYPWATLTEGVGTGNALPEGVAALVVLYTDVKRVIGKKYFGGFGSVALDDFVWDAAAKTLLDTVASDMLSPFTAAGTDTVIHGVYRRALGTFVQLRSAVARTVPAYQRRRKPGVGS